MELRLRGARAVLPAAGACPPLGFVRCLPAVYVPRALRNVKNSRSDAVRVKFFGESQSINAKDKKRTFRYPLGVEARTKKGSQ